MKSQLAEARRYPAGCPADNCQTGMEDHEVVGVPDERRSLAILPLRVHGHHSLLYIVQADLREQRGQEFFPWYAVGGGREGAALHDTRLQPHPDHPPQAGAGVQLLEERLRVKAGDAVAQVNHQHIRRLVPHLPGNGRESVLARSPRVEIAAPGGAHRLPHRLENDPDQGLPGSCERGREALMYVHPGVCRSMSPARRPALRARMDLLCQGEASLGMDLVGPIGPGHAPWLYGAYRQQPGCLGLHQQFLQLLHCPDVAALSGSIDALLDAEYMPL